MLLLGVLFCHVSTVPAQQHLRVEDALETPTQAASTLAVCVGGTGCTCSLSETGRQATSRRNVSSRARGSQVPAANSSPPSVDRTASWGALSPSPFSRAQSRARLSHVSPTHSAPGCWNQTDSRSIPAAPNERSCRSDCREPGFQSACLWTPGGSSSRFSVPGVQRKPTSAWCAAACPGHNAVPGAGAPGLR